MKNQFSLRKIAEWNKEDSEVKIPELQRGLVWSPKQIEFLWDSLLRGFPIGGFVLSENQDKSYYLMDGQQRWNTISLGFRKPSKDSDSFLWLDINPGQNAKSTRKYFAKVITKAHPWGFKNDEDCSSLSAKETKDAMKNMWERDDINIFNEEISIDTAFPFEANFPIPMYKFLNAKITSKEDFLEDIKNGVDNLSKQWKNKFWTETNQNFLKNNIDKFFNVFSMLSKYKVSVNILSKQTIENEDEEIEIVTEDADSINQTNLEILFTRLNTMGTRISQDDLYYSAIKAYWGGIKEKIEKIANGKIAPAKLTTTLFRLILTINDKKTNEFHNQLTITKIRILAKDEKKKNLIEDFINKNAKKLVDGLNDKLKEIPKYLKVKIISETEEIYLLLLYLMYLKVDIDYEALALLLYFFVKIEKGKKTRQNFFDCINHIFKRLKEISEPTNIKYNHALQRAFSQLIAENKIWNIENPDSFEIAQINEYIREWKKIPSWYYFWEHVTNEKDFLIYAQKEFLISKFSNYNPADLKSCEGHNRPWDYDHIIPHNWSKNKRGAYKSIVDYWLWKNGNFAAIPYSENRSKSDNPSWDYYKKNFDSLLFDGDFEQIEKDIITNKNMASSFSTLVFERSKKIYSKIYNKVECFICGNFTSDEIGRRKTFFNDLLVKIRRGYRSLEWNCYFEANDWDYEIENDNHWSYPKVTFGVPFYYDNYMVAVTWEIGNSNLILGIRGRKNEKTLKSIFSKFNDGFSDSKVDEYFWFVKKELEIQDQLSVETVFDILCPIINYLRDINKW